MSNEEAIHILQCIEHVGISLTKLSENVSDHSTMTSDAINMAIEALEKAYRFEHVIIHHPKYGDCDGWLDRERMLLLCDAVTCEFAHQHGWTWETT